MTIKLIRRDDRTADFALPCKSQAGLDSTRKKANKRTSTISTSGYAPTNPARRVHFSKIPPSGMRVIGPRKAATMRGLAAAAGLAIMEFAQHI